jgi:hypothetical protein
VDDDSVAPPVGDARRREAEWAALEDWHWAVLGRKVGCAAEQESWAAGGKNELGHRG